MGQRDDMWCKSYAERARSYTRYVRAFPDKNYVWIRIVVFNACHMHLMFLKVFCDSGTVEYY